MSWLRWLRSPRRSAFKSHRPCSLAIEHLESRLNPSYTFNAGILIIQADTQNSNDYVHISAAGAANDGTTGVRVESNLVNGGKATTIGSAANPVLRITLDMKDGNDDVEIAGLAQTKVLVGEGNGNNVVNIGDSLVVAFAAGSGRNDASLGGGSNATVLEGYGPGYTLAPAGTVTLIGWTYSVNPTTGGLSVPTQIGNNHDNAVVVHDQAGESAIVDIAGNGGNFVHTGQGDDIVWIQGNGDNLVLARKGHNTIEVDGNGDNYLRADGTGSITVVGQGDNSIHAGKNTADSVFVSFTGSGGHNSVTTESGAAVTVNGVVVTASGLIAGTHTHVKFKTNHGGTTTILA